MGNVNDRARVLSMLAVMGLAIPAAAQSDPLAEPFGPSFDWRDLLPSRGGDGSLGYVLQNCGHAWSMSEFQPPLRAGDINGDGLEDLLHDVAIYDPRTKFGFGVLMSMADSPAIIDISDPIRNPGFQFRFTPIGAGPSTNVGDINGDGIDDVAGSETQIVSGRGDYYFAVSHIVFGRDEAASGAFDPIDPDTPTMTLSGSYLFDTRIFNQVGDVNGDGLDDLALSHGGRSPYGWSYSAAVVFGRTPGDLFPRFASPATLRDSSGGVFFGCSDRDISLASRIESAGDLNRDGVRDLLIPTSWTSQRSGAYVVFGRAPDDPFPLGVDVATLDEDSAVFLDASDHGVHIRTVGSLGDINGDGIEDVGVSAYIDSQTYSLYVVFGRYASHRSPFPPVVNLSDLDGEDGFRIVASASSLQRHPIRRLGDVNGDQVDDILLKDRVIYGCADWRYEPLVQVGDIGPAQSVSFNGVLHGVGDVNADGVPDISVGYLGGAECEVAAIVYGRRPPPPCPADMDRDGRLTLFDWLTFTTAWQDQQPIADVDGDGGFSLMDYLVYQAWFHYGCP
ncbi:MAG: GC-type dockerin domain-anchored protein [Phycisphaerales bacterium JB064]